MHTAKQNTTQHSTAHTHVPIVAFDCWISSNWLFVCTQFNLLDYKQLHTYVYRPRSTFDPDTPITSLYSFSAFSLSPYVLLRVAHTPHWHFNAPRICLTCCWELPVQATMFRVLFACYCKCKKQFLWQIADCENQSLEQCIVLLKQTTTKELSPIYHLVGVDTQQAIASTIVYEINSSGTQVKIYLEQIFCISNYLYSIELIRFHFALELLENLSNIFRNDVFCFYHGASKWGNVE